MAASDAGSPLTLVPRAGCFEGLVACRGDVAIDGSVSGEVIAQGRLVLGEASSVEARIEGDEVVVRGSLEGEVRAQSRIELGPASTVIGSLCAPRIAVAEGSCFDGQLDMASPEQRGPSLFSA